MTSEKEKEALKILLRIRGNTTLQILEETGFKIGCAHGKTMNVDISTIKQSLQKQYDDFQEAWYRYVIEKSKLNQQKLEKCLADIRNVAGCFFLKLKERES